MKKIIIAGADSGETCVTEKSLKRNIFLILFSLLSNISYASEKQALDLIKSLGKDLQKELKKGLKKSTVGALRACNLKAPVIADKYSLDNIHVGRVSIKNRSPQNVPKKWMFETINLYHSGKIKNGYKVVKISHGRKGILKPIKTMPVCLQCHGINISTNVKTEISKFYPKDKATGFKVGSIRGFFWAEYSE